MRHYYDVHQLLIDENVRAFIGTDQYYSHKKKRFRQADDPDISKNPAFTLSAPETRASYGNAYEETSALYYRGKPTLSEILAVIGAWAERL